MPCAAIRRASRKGAIHDASEDHQCGGWIEHSDPAFREMEDLASFHPQRIDDIRIGDMIPRGKHPDDFVIQHEAHYTTEKLFMICLLRYGR